ncbi:MAG: hypothetical protein NTX36_04625 [Proteobacteria bacterium]|nr:hypothetical protein [Pseudomonadota bacterium]
MKIEIRTNVQLPEIPSVMEVESGSTLRDVLAVIAPQLIDPETGNMKSDQDIWGIRLNDESYGLLRNGLSTPMREGDIIALSLILMAGG